MLNREEIKKLIEQKGLVKDYRNLDIQLTPNGLDATVGKIFEFGAPGALDFSNSERVVPEGKEIFSKKENIQDKYGWWNLSRGAYKVRTNEVFNMPKDLTAIAFSRSSLLRMGALTQTAVWEAGFKGKAEFILVVENPKGIRLKQNARVTQVVFIKIKAPRQGYNGIYQES